MLMHNLNAIADPLIAGFNLGPVALKSTVLRLSLTEIDVSNDEPRTVRKKCLLSGFLLSEFSFNFIRWPQEERL